MTTVADHGATYNDWRIPCALRSISTRSTALTRMPMRSFGSTTKPASGPAKGHSGIQLPEWGMLRVDTAGTLVCGQHDARPLFSLEGLAMEAQTGPFEGESGEALWHCENGPCIAGHWHVQCIDKDAVLAEHSMFAEDEV
jgi:hypothetical protein